ncbi:MAG: ImmA/IrrE family metallo-endopeptidase [Deferribacteres bacterium]|nr:ImmA/IrrE family metallo-endopeptidase [Deferribacteres bacterium]
MIRVDVEPALLRWAIKRARLSTEDLQRKFPKIVQWEQRKAKPTLTQLENFAKAVRLPVGYLFLSEPPEERIPIPDLRTMSGTTQRPPSPDLLDVIYLCQRRQAWYRDYARSAGEETCPFVGSGTIDSPVEEAAEAMRQALNFGIEERQSCPSWTEALRQFIDHAEDMGVLVMISGVVGTNNRRRLDPGEFRGFALTDDLAPLVFINGADTKAAQIFTLAHELAHIWLGKSAVSDAGPDSAPPDRTERWCNAVAAEFLVPFQDLREYLHRKQPLEEVQNLARRFKVSTLVILRRLLDAKKISRQIFTETYSREAHKLRERAKSSPGGDFYLTQDMRTSRRFVRSLIVSTLEGQTLYREAFQLLGIRKEQTFNEWKRRLGVGV